MYILNAGVYMHDKSALKVLQGVLSDLEGLGKMYRSDAKVSRALHNAYQSAAQAGAAILDKMTRDEAEAARQLEEERKRRAERDE
jgi:hypothetical protein